MAEGSFAEISDDTKWSTEEMSGAMERLTLVSAKDEASAGNGASSSSDPGHASSEYFSGRIESIMESRDKFETALEAEIEASRVHWSEVQQPESEGEGGAEANMRMFRSLQEQYPSPDGSFFWDWGDSVMALGEKIAEGAQGAIYGVKFLVPELVLGSDKFVVKVFKLEGWSLEDLQSLWPSGMLSHLANGPGESLYLGECCAPVSRGVMLKDGSFGFFMRRYWGDLRKAIDLRMQHNGNHAPPFSNKRALEIIHMIAVGMRGLHEDGIVHRDLKASNVLILPWMWVLPPGLAHEESDVTNNDSFASHLADWVAPFGHSHEEFDVTNNDFFASHVADFECSGGVVGTRFWRAPEILLGLKNGDRPPSLWSEKSDVYSYAMTCYEVLTGKIPFEHLCPKDYDVVLQGGRPTLPSGIDPRIQALLNKCWHHDPLERPSFKEIVDIVFLLKFLG